MSITAVPISMRLVRAPIAGSSGDGEAGWRAEGGKRPKAPASPSPSAAPAGPIVFTCASRPLPRRGPRAPLPWPNEGEPELLGRLGELDRLHVRVARRPRARPRRLLPVAEREEPDPLHACDGTRRRPRAHADARRPRRRPGPSGGGSEAL